MLSRALGVGLKLKAIPARCHGSSPCRKPVFAFTEGFELVVERSLLLEGPGTPHAQRRRVLVMGSGAGAEDRQGQGVAPLLPLPLPPGRGLLGVFWGRFRTCVGRKPPQPVSCTSLNVETSCLGIRKLTSHLSFCEATLPSPRAPVRGWLAFVRQYQAQRACAVRH